jgi:hypothetical protein
MPWKDRTARRSGATAEGLSSAAGHPAPNIDPAAFGYGHPAPIQEARDAKGIFAQIVTVARLHYTPSRPPRWL